MRHLLSKPPSPLSRPFRSVCEGCWGHKLSRAQEAEQGREGGRGSKEGRQGRKGMEGREVTGGREQEGERQGALPGGTRDMVQMMWARSILGSVECRSRSDRPKSKGAAMSLPTGSPEPQTRVQAADTI